MSLVKLTTLYAIEVDTLEEVIALTVYNTDLACLLMAVTARNAHVQSLHQFIDRVHNNERRHIKKACSL